MWTDSAYIFTVKTADVLPFSAILQFFFRVPLNVLVRTPWGMRTPGWESLV
jgi:hypothetical protein